jgi:hypothetical protein
VRKPLGLLAVLLCTPAAWANDSDAVIEGGRVVLRKSANVVMEDEDLWIAPGEVKVAYRFVNRSDKDVDTHVAFPIAVDRDEDPDEGAASGPSADLAASFGFKLWVDGAARPVKAEVKPSAKRNEVLFHWPQTFPAGRPVAVKHVYTPRGGFIYAAEHMTAADWAKLSGAYCIDPPLLAWMKRRKEGSATQVHYILKTAANWAGPIGRFRLTIQKDTAGQKVSFCASGVKKTGPRTFVVEKKDFTPTEDLKVLFIGE